MTLKDEIFLDPGEVPMATASRVRGIQAATMMFEAEHGECIRVLPYTEDVQIVVQFYVFRGESGISKDLTEEAQTFFEDMTVKLEWPDLYNSNVNILNVQRHEYSSWRTQITDCSSGWRVDSGEELYSLIPKRVQERHKNKTTAGFN